MLQLSSEAAAFDLLAFTAWEYVALIFVWWLVPAQLIKRQIGGVR